MAPERETRAVAKLDVRGAAGNLTDEPITIGPDKTIRVDMSKLPSPANVYDADVAWVEHRAPELSLMFAKNRRGTDGFRTRLEVRYPTENLVRQLWKNSRRFHESLRTQIAKWNFTRSGSANPGSLSADKDHSDWANFESMAFAGTEACVDFYRLPPSGIAQFAAGQGSAGLRCTSVVRIQLSIFQLLALLDSMEPIVAEVESYLPSDMLAKQESRP